MQLSDTLKIFLDSREGLLARKSIIAYRHSFAVLLANLGNVHAQAVTTDDLRRFRADLANRQERYADHPARAVRAGGLSVASVNTHLGFTRTLFRFLYQEGHIERDPAQGLKGLPIPTRPPKAITDNDLALLFRAALDNTNIIHAVRDYAFLRLLAETGCRMGGIMGLTLGDIDLSKGRALVKEKGEKSRWVYFSADTSAALVRYLGYHPAARLVGWQIEVVEPAAKLWRGVRGDWTTYGGVDVLRRLAEKAGIQGRFNPHSFRHRFAISYLDNGGDLASLSQIMGHSDVRVTEQFYARWAGDDLQAKHDQFTSLPDVPDVATLPKQPRLRVVRRKRRIKGRGQRRARGA